MKFWSSNPSFNRKILRSLYLKFKSSAHEHIAITYHFVIIYKFLVIIWIIWILNALWGYILVGKVGQWFYQLDRVTFPENIFWSVNWTLFYNQIYTVQMSSLNLVEGLAFKERNCTPFIKSYLSCMFPTDTMWWNFHIVCKNE